MLISSETDLAVEVTTVHEDEQHACPIETACRIRQVDAWLVVLRKVEQRLRAGINAIHHPHLVEKK
jgi:hypothetical protein